MRVLNDPFEQELEHTFQKHRFHYGDTFEAAKYALFNGGKRLRPLLLLGTLESYGYPIEEGYSAANSLEFIHTYSLIHDDLPSMDDDDFRRGQPAVHKVYGEGIAILAGDFLLTLAFETLAASDYEEKAKLIEVLAKASGMQGMIGGQTLDLEMEGKECPLYIIEEMHRLKSGKLMGAALEMAAILLQKERQIFKELGEMIGIAFQIKNDMNDPKERDSDTKKKKATYLSSTTDPEKYLEAAKQKIEASLLEMNLNQSPLHSIIGAVL